MESQLSRSARWQLDRFARQYSQLESDLDFPPESCLRNHAFQQALEANLFKVAPDRAPPQRYQLRVLKILVEKIEQSVQDWDVQAVSDDLMGHLSTLFSSSVPTEATAAQHKSCVTYTLSSLGSEDHEPPLVSLLESRNLIAAAGTTGLRTWEAALHLGEYLCTVSPSLVQGRSILELGAGTGYISILCAKYLHASHVAATDGSYDVVAGLANNFDLNGLHGKSNIHAHVLKWGEALIDARLPESDDNETIDLVFGADVTYDETAISALISTFEGLLTKYPNVKIITAATLRNLKTFDFFKEACRQRDYNFEEIDFNIKTGKLQMGPFYPDKVPIRICLITRL